MSAEQQISPAELQQLLRYEAETGKLYWLAREGNKAFNGRFAGVEALTHTLNGGKALQGRIHGLHFLAHRVAWALSYGHWPENQIDHINGNPLDNRIGNLRDVSSSQNARNRRLSKANKSGVPGVFWLKDRNRWWAKIRHGGRNISLGRFACKDDAVRARKRAEARFGYHPNHGRA